MIRRLKQQIARWQPWYDWGETFIDRLDSSGEGQGWFFTFQWLGINVTIFFGRTPQSTGPYQPIIICEGEVAS